MLKQNFSQSLDFYLAILRFFFYLRRAVLFLKEYANTLTLYFLFYGNGALLQMSDNNSWDGNGGL